MKRILCLLGVVAPLYGQELPNPWERLSRFDENNDGKVTRAEFRGPPQLFDRLDRDQDGVISRAEAAASRHQNRPSPNALEGRGQPGAMLIARIDSNGDQQISFEEWTEFFQSADENGDGVLQGDEWRAAMRREPLQDPAPAVGARAPELKLRSLRTNQDVDLSQVRRVTVLVFGSYT